MYWCLVSLEVRIQPSGSGRIPQSYQDLWVRSFQLMNQLTSNKMMPKRSCHLQLSPLWFGGYGQVRWPTTCTFTKMTGSIRSLRFSPFWYLERFLPSVKTLMSELACLLCPPPMAQSHTTFSCPFSSIRCLRAPLFVKHNRPDCLFSEREVYL